MNQVRDVQGLVNEICPEVRFAGKEMNPKERSRLVDRIKEFLGLLCIHYAMYVLYCTGMEKRNGGLGLCAGTNGVRVEVRGTKLWKDQNKEEQKIVGYRDQEQAMSP